MFNFMNKQNAQSNQFSSGQSDNGGSPQVDTSSQFNSGGNNSVAAPQTQPWNNTPSPYQPNNPQTPQQTYNNAGTALGAASQGFNWNPNNDPTTAFVLNGFGRRGINPRDQQDLNYWTSKVNQGGGLANEGNKNYWDARFGAAQGGVGDYLERPEAGVSNNMGMGGDTNSILQMLFGKNSNFRGPQYGMAQPKSVPVNMNQATGQNFSAAQNANQAGNAFDMYRALLGSPTNIYGPSTGQTAGGL